MPTKTASNRSMTPAPDFHMALLWLRSMESIIGHSAVVLLSEVEQYDLFGNYRPLVKA